MGGWHGWRGWVACRMGGGDGVDGWRVGWVAGMAWWVAARGRRC